MKSVFKSLLLFVLISASCAVVSYRDYRVVKFTIETEEQLAKAIELSTREGFKYWDIPVQTNMETDLILSPDAYIIFQEEVEESGIKYELLTEDLQLWFDDERPISKRKAWGFDQYNTYADILNFLDEMNARYPEITQIFTIGNTFEGRPIKAIRISTNLNNPAIFIESNIHAREWITSATSVWLINEFLTSTNSTVRSLIEDITWYIIPMLNSDGYEYSYNVDRLWRKTRSTYGSMLCSGADANRNFGYNWMEGGSSAVPCTDTYAGIHAFSEPEAKAIIDFYATVYQNVRIFLSFHSATQALLFPWGTNVGPAPNYNDLKVIGEAAIAALKARHGTEYVSGNTVEILYVASGTTPDHVYGFFNTSLAYTYEMRHATEGSRFVLPPEEIIPNAEEILESLIGMIDKSKELGYFN